MVAFHFLKVSRLFPSIITFKIYSFIFMDKYVCVPAWVYVCHVHPIPNEVSRGQWTLHNWSYGQLFASRCECVNAGN